MSGKHGSYSFESFSRMPIIDGHLHVWRGYKPELIWETLSAVGVQRCNALSLNIFEHGGTYNAEAMDFKCVSNGMAYAFGSIDYTRHLQGGKMTSADLIEQARQIQASGFDGIKMWEGKPLGYVLLPDRLDGEFFDPFFTWMESEGFPIILHLGDAARFWDPARKGLDLWNYSGEPYPTRQQMYAELENILDRHPRLKLILAHFLFLWDELAEARRTLDAHPSIAFDLTPGVHGYVQLGQDAAAARQFFLDHQDRLIYGTDIGTLPLLDPTADFVVDLEAGQPWLVRTFLESDLDIPFPDRIGVTRTEFADDRLRGITLPDSTLEKIYRLNFERMVGAEPTRI